jgi:hypothetical protein
MAKAKTAQRPQNRRGSPEAIEKRRVARMFNDVLGSGAPAAKLDGRTAKRRERLLRELEENRAHGQRELKPLDILQRIQELLELGEPLTAIKKVRKIPKPSAPTANTVELIQRLHHAYRFKPETYRFVGISDDVLGEAGVLATEGKRGAKRRRAA